jgi:hypothetical protein
MQNRSFYFWRVQKGLTPPEAPAAYPPPVPRGAAEPEAWARTPSGRQENARRGVQQAAKKTRLQKILKKFCKNT